jgi:hypothetical protein
MAQIISITSEALQATIRRLLPSQQGFGEDLQASNVIQPIIDLTPTAEGSALPLELANALAHGSNTFFEGGAGSTNIITTAGFYRIIGTASLQVNASAAVAAAFAVNDGSSDVFVYNFKSDLGANGVIVTESYDFNVFLSAGDTFKSSNSTGGIVSGSFRQIADVYGNIVNPSGFTFE